TPASKSRMSCAPYLLRWVDRPSNSVKIDFLELLNDIEVRVLGSLIEKEITTPDYYPLSLNALMNACNQSSNRNPVVHFDEDTVVRAADKLRDKQLLHLVDKSDSRVTKYRHVVYETLNFDRRQIAV